VRGLEFAVPHVAPSKAVTALLNADFPPCE
jgi:hypothetical protein